MQRGFAHLGILVVFVIFIGAIVLSLKNNNYPFFNKSQLGSSGIVNELDNKEEKTAEISTSDDSDRPGWHIVTNKEFGYQVSVPKEWYLESEERGDSIGLISTDTRLFGLAITPYNIRSEEVEEFNRDYDSKKFTNLEIDSQKTIKRYFPPKPNSDSYPQVSYRILKEVYKDKNRFYDLSFGASIKENLDENSKLMDSIAATFKFTQFPPEKSGKRTYKNVQYGYSFDYPEDWILRYNEDHIKQGIGGVFVWGPKWEGDMSELVTFEKGDSELCDTSEDSEKEWTFEVGEQNVVFKSNCALGPGESGAIMKSKNGALILIHVKFVGTRFEDQGKALLKSIKGLQTR